tara:strand:- start:1025 stop:1300 length:276 start_codon:yes stop_codon:yes gene_type:complete
MSETTENKKSEWAEREIGALWKRQGSSQKYLSGKLKLGNGEVLNVVVFTNSRKEAGSNQPDFRVYREKPLQEQETQNEEKSVQEEIEEGVL